MLELLLLPERHGERSPAGGRVAQSTADQLRNSSVQHQRPLSKARRGGRNWLKMTLAVCFPSGSMTSGFGPIVPYLRASRSAINSAADLVCVERAGGRSEAAAADQAAERWCCRFRSGRRRTTAARSSKSSSASRRTERARGSPGKRAAAVVTSRAETRCLEGKKERKFRRLATSTRNTPWIKIRPRPREVILANKICDRRRDPTFPGIAAYVHPSSYRPETRSQASPDSGLVPPAPLHHMLLRRLRSSRAIVRFHPCCASA